MTARPPIHQSVVLLYFLIFLLGGIFFGSLIHWRQPAWLAFFVLGLSLIFVFWQRHSKLMFVGFCLLGLGLGGWRASVFNQVDFSPQQLRFLNDQKTISFLALVSSEPQIKQDKQQLIVEARQLLEPTQQQALSGKLWLSINKYPQYQYGDILKITGKLKTPENFNGFDWRGYLAREHIYSVMYQPKIEKIGSENSRLKFFVLGKIFAFKNKLRQVVDEQMSAPQNDLLKALLFGDQYRLSPELKEQFSATGVQHIVAISGTNMVILAQILFWLLLYLGFWRNQIFYLVVTVLTLYIIMIGLPASAVRAAIMTSLLLLAQKVGRMNSASRAILLAAGLMAWVKPTVLRWDIGFQLSFAAVLGLIYLKPLLDQWLKNNTEKSFVKDLISMTLAAQIATTALVMYYFGRFSLIGLLANLAIVPLASIAFSAGLALVFSGLFWSQLAQIISWPLSLILGAMLKMTELFSQPSFASLNITQFSWPWLIIYYGLLIILVKFCRDRSRPVSTTDATLPSTAS